MRAGQPETTTAYVKNSEERDFYLNICYKKPINLKPLPQVISLTYDRKLDKLNLEANVIFITYEKNLGECVKSFYEHMLSNDVITNYLCGGNFGTYVKNNAKERTVRKLIFITYENKTTTLREIFIKKYEEGNSMELNEKQKEVIEGCLLGDGSLYIRKNVGCVNANFQYHIVEKGHMEFIKKIFDDVGLQYTTTERKNDYHLYTPVSSDLTEMYEKWYKDGSKWKIPRDFELTPLKVLLWYVGDGSYNTTDKKNKHFFLTLSKFADYYIKKVNTKFEKVLGSQLKPVYNKKGEIRDLKTTKITRKKFRKYIQTEYSYPKCYDHKFPRLDGI